MDKVIVWDHTRFEQGLKTDAEWAAEKGALGVVDEWTMITSGICSLKDLGYRTADGGVPAWKLRQMLDLSGLIQSARARRRKK